MLDFLTRSSEKRIPLEGVVAIIGCDGTGKTTLTHDLLATLRQRGPAERRYLGLVSGEMGDKIKALPFIGVRLEGNLHNKADRALDMEKKLPGVGTALIMYGLSLWRAAQLRRVIRLSRRGVKVIADRYPQVEVPGFHYDGPGLTVSRTDNWLVRKLADREQKMYEWMAAQKPALVIRLTIDIETALKRKPDHPVAELQNKISVMPLLTFSGAQVCDIDSTAPYAQVLEAAVQAINKSQSTSS